MVEHVNFRNAPSSWSPLHHGSSIFSGFFGIILVAVSSTFLVVGSTGLAYRFYQKRKERQHSLKLSNALRRSLIEEENFGSTNGSMKKSWSMNSQSSSGSSHDKARGGTKSYGSPSESITTLSQTQAVPLNQDMANKVEGELGNLTFATFYDSQKQVLLVTIIKCSDLPTRDVQLNTSDPYVKLQILPEKRHRVKTRVLRKTTNPVFEETFTFFGISANQIKSLSLHFVVLSFDRFSRDDVIGEVLCNLSNIDITASEETSMTMDIRPRQFKLQNQHRGELLVSVCHQPAATRLTVVVLKARNLPKMDVTGLAGDPYVKIYLLYNGQRIAKKKTHVKKRTLNPVYNESFTFECPAYENINNLSLEFILLDWDRVTKNEVIGRLEIGSSDVASASTLGNKHWKQVEDNPRKQIAEWHKLTN